MTVLVIGGANLDVLARSSRPLRAHTSNPGTVLRTYGGVGRNVAENLARLGTPTRMLLAVGDDTAGQEVLARTRFAGVRTLRVPWEGPTGTYTALLDDDGSLVAGVADMAATDAITPEHVDGAGVADAEWLVLDGNLPAATLAHALRLADAAVVPVVLDPVSAPKASLIASHLDGVPVHTLTPTIDELAALTGDEVPGSAAASLHARGVEVVWLREGVRGSTLFRRDLAPEQVALPAVAAVGVTGAGDAMLAAYVHALGRGADLRRAAYEGAAAAMLTVQSTETVRPDLSAALIDAALEAFA